jgi:hypothetical protein
VSCFNFSACASSIGGRLELARYSAYVPYAAQVREVVKEQQTGKGLQVRGMRLTKDAQELEPRRGFRVFAKLRNILMVEKLPKVVEVRVRDRLCPVRQKRSQLDAHPQGGGKGAL